MIKNSFFLILFLTTIWIILCEKISVVTVAIGIAISIFCLVFFNKYLPQYKITDINYLRFALYPFYLIGQIYLASFSAIRIILTDARVDIVEVKTNLSNGFLRIVLANSITLVPGSVSLDLKDDTITVLWLRKKTASPQTTENAGELLKGRLERLLMKIQKQAK